METDEKLQVLDINPENLPPNSDAYKQAQRTKRQTEDRQERDKKKVEYTITKKEKTFGEKLKEAVFGENVKDVPDHIFFKIIVPNVLRMFGDSVQGALGMTFKGLGRKTDDRYRDDGSPYRSYDRAYESRRRTDASAVDFDDYIFNNAAGVQYVIDELDETLDRYKCITVADVCSLVGKPPRSIDNKWGWYSTRDFEIVQVRDGWILSVPRARSLD